MFEQALMRLFGEQRGRIPSSVVAWLVTGEFAAPTLRWDVSYPAAACARLPGL
ncbi:hypothetical protein [Mycobacterium lentiflavum]|uniref:hypothetical protein n=1 Tax=Mycobacterium lentiflavum TaxID=141349 RepID=UPI000A9F1E0C|nr:hypothetical protein [Mycobacterium lentiflavum]